MQNRRIDVRVATVLIAGALSAGHANGQDCGPSAVTLAEHGKSAWQIVTPHPEALGTSWACQELKRYIREISGCDLPVAEAAAKGPAIVIGLREGLPAAEKALLPAAAKGYDGYSIAIRAATADAPARVVIGGDNPRGVIYGAYDLLERLGCRWCYPTQDPKDPEVVPKSDTPCLKSGAWSVASPMQYRICNGDAWFFEMNLDAARRQLDWGMKNRYNTMGWQSESKTTLESQYQRLKAAGLFDEIDRRDMLLHGPGHSFDHFLRAEDHMAKHPEWFGLRDGKRVPQSFVGAQFCWSNVEARKQFVENVAAFVKASPRINILLILSFDGGRACACEECKKAGASNLLMTLMSEVIERLAAVSPKLLIETVGGYEPMTEPPTGVKIHPKQRVLWAHWGRYYDRGYGDAGYDRRENLEMWRKAAKAGMTICEYFTDNFAEPWVLPPFTLSLIGDRKYFIENGIESVYMLMWPPGYWWNHGLNGYLGGRCFYDASLDPYKEIHDYALHYYGKDAGPLIGTYYEQWGRNVDLAYRVKGDSRDSERAILAEQRAKLIDPAIKAVAGDPVLSYRVGKVAKLHTLAEKLAEGQRLRQEIQRLRERKQYDEAGQRLAKARPYVDEILAYFHTLADLNQGLMDKNEIPSFITWGVKNWLDEEAKAISEAREQARMDGVDPAFTNPIAEGADPFVIRKGDSYYFCQSEGDKGIAVWKSDRLTDKGVKRLVWLTPKTGWNRDEVWAPELHYLRSHWYVYYAASDGKNANHRSGVLEAATDDPQGKYIDKGLLYTGDDVKGKTTNRWSIDATPLELGDRLYLVWSGWPAEKDVQYLYIAPMSDPCTVAGNRVKLCENDTYAWERVAESTNERGLHEGPQVIKRDGKVIIVYSCSGSWEPTYKLGLIYMDEKSDPLDPKSWTKPEKPAFRGTDRMFGIGHCSFTTSPDGKEDWIVYHAKRAREPGWQRAIFVQPFGWGKDGLPEFGEPVPPGRVLKAPAGETANRPGTTFRDSFEKDNWDNWSYYGYNRFIWVEDGQMHVGGRPSWGVVNDYRCGEKALVRGSEWADLTLKARVRIEQGDGDAGLLFRVRRPAVGYDAQQGYFVGIIPRTKKVVLGRMNGFEWKELAIADQAAVAGRWYTLRIEAKGDEIRVFVDDALKITTKDATYSRGMVGVRVVDTHAVFDEFEVITQ